MGDGGELVTQIIGIDGEWWQSIIGDGRVAARCIKSITHAEHTCADESILTGTGIVTERGGATEIAEAFDDGGLGSDAIATCYASVR